MVSIIAATRDIGDDYGSVYIRELSAVIFSQVFHVLCLFWVLKMLTDKWTLGSIFIIIALIIVGISGAHIIRRFTFSTGASQIVGGSSKMAVYKFMARK